MKKIVSLVITASIILSQSISTPVYATDVITNGGNVSAQPSTSSNVLETYKLESELFGTTYEETKQSIPYTIAATKDEREEFTLDRNGLSSITSLRAITSANYAIILSYPDKNTHVTTADTLQAAILKANGLAGSDPNAIPAVLDNQSGFIVYATQAMGRVAKVVDGQIYFPTDRNSNVYSSSYLSQAYTYINHGYVDDIPILEDNGTSAKVEVSGYTGWMRKDTNWVNPQTSQKEFDLIVVPINKAINPSYYISEYGELKHTISYDITSTSGGSHTLKLGAAPTFMNSGVKYYSYDGNYFYTNLKTLISDGKAGHHNNAVNANTPYYNYYQYLPFRSKSAFSADQINTYLDTRAGLTQTSKLRGVGQALVNGQNNNGVNALITFGVAANESALGSSSISQQKNNIFGINAVDSNPAGSANAFASVADCINDFTKNYFSRDYGDPDDWKHHGAYLGNKNLGANVKYASDPFWGEKAAQFMYKMDYHTSNYVVTNAGSNASTGNLKEFNRYQLAAYSKPSDVFTSTSSSGTKLYTISQEVKTGAAKVGNVFVVKNTNLYNSGTTSYYNIVPDRSTIPWSAGGRFDGTFDWTKEAYIKSDSVKFINTVANPSNPVENKKGWVQEGNYWYYYDLNTGIKKTGWLQLGKYWYYLDGNGVMKTGWVNLGGNWYYFYAGGDMKTGWLTINGYKYYLDSSGVMKTGWAFIDNNWYYFYAGGDMKTGWLTINNYKYYLDSNGIMKTGWVYIDNNWYYFYAGGDMKTGWLTINNYKYYLDSNGVMKTGWVSIDNNRYYFHAGGDMKTGWLLDDGKWYYLYSDGKMAYNTTIDGYKLSSNGVRIN